MFCVTGTELLQNHQNWLASVELAKQGSTSVKPEELKAATRALDIELYAEFGRSSIEAFCVILDSGSIIAKEPQRTLCGDQLLLGLSHVKRTYQPWYMRVGAEMAIIAHKALEEVPFKALNDLRHMAASVSAQIRHYWKHTMYPEEINKKLEIVQHRLFAIASFINEWILDDPFTKYAVDGRFSYAPRTRFDLLMAHPVLCGLIADTLQSRLHECALYLCNAKGLITPLAHLHNAAVQVLPDAVPWEDIDVHVSHQGNNHIFVGDKPTCTDGIIKHLALALGAPVSDFAAAHTHRDTSKSGREIKCIRPLKELSPTLKMVRDLRLQKKVDTLFRDIMVHTKHTAGTFMDAVKESPTSQDHRVRTILTLWKSTKSVDAVEMLHTIGRAKCDEVPEFSLNYLSLFNVCQAFVAGQVKALLERRGLIVQEFEVVPMLISRINSDRGLFERAVDFLESLRATIGQPMVDASHLEGSNKTRDDSPMVPISDDTFLSKDKVLIYWRRYWDLVQGIQSDTIQGAFLKIDALCLTIYDPIFTLAPSSQLTRGQIQDINEQMDAGKDPDLSKYKIRITDTSSGMGNEEVKVENKKRKVHRQAKMIGGRRR